MTKKKSPKSRSAPETWTLHPDRGFPAEKHARAAAREIYAATRTLPIVAPRTSVPMEWFGGEIPWNDPADFVIGSDHQLTSLIASFGQFTLAELGVIGKPPDSSVIVETDPRQIWKRFCESWPLLKARLPGLWIAAELVNVLGIRMEPGAKTAKLTYQQASETLAKKRFTPLQLLDHFDIEVLGTRQPKGAEGVPRLLAYEDLGGRVIPWSATAQLTATPRLRALASLRSGIPNADLVWDSNGFVHDDGGFGTIPGRHDVARRLDAGMLGGLVAEHRLDLAEAKQIAADLTYHLPLKSALAS